MCWKRARLLRPGAGSANFILMTGEDGYCKSSPWNHVAFEHPATFETLEMDPNKLERIIDDLITFSKAKE